MEDAYGEHFGSAIREVAWYPLAEDGSPRALGTEDVQRSSSGEVCACLETIYEMAALARPALPDIVLVVRLTVDGAVNAIDTTSVTVGGAELSPKALTDALDRARALATARRDLASLFRGGSD